jgi:hypothetical protein
MSSRNLRFHHESILASDYDLLIALLILGNHLINHRCSQSLYFDGFVALFSCLKAKQISTSTCELNTYKRQSKLKLYLPAISVYCDDSMTFRETPTWKLNMFSESLQRSVKESYCLVKSYLIYFTEIYWHSSDFISHFSCSRSSGGAENKRIFELPIIIPVFEFLRWIFFSSTFSFCYLTLTVAEDSGDGKSSRASGLNETERSTVAFGAMKSRWEDGAALSERNEVKSFEGESCGKCRKRVEKSGDEWKLEFEMWARREEGEKLLAISSCSRLPLLAMLLEWIKHSHDDIPSSSTEMQLVDKSQLTQLNWPFNGDSNTSF